MRAAAASRWEPLSSRRQSHEVFVALRPLTVLVAISVHQPEILQDGTPCFHERILGVLRALPLGRLTQPVLKLPQGQRLTRVLVAELQGLLDALAVLELNGLRVAFQDLSHG